MKFPNLRPFEDTLPYMSGRTETNVLSRSLLDEHEDSLRIGKLAHFPQHGRGKSTAASRCNSLFWKGIWQVGKRKAREWTAEGAD